MVPARMASTRLPGKPLAEIAGQPMIVQVLRRAREADVGPVVVACAEPEIAEAVRAAGGEAVLTRPDHPSGSDRIFEALQALDPEGAERLFEAFYTTKTEGVGIGLSISRSIIEAHGGRLWAGANAPHGAVFRFSLPVAGEGQP